MSHGLTPAPAVRARAERTDAHAGPRHRVHQRDLDLHAIAAIQGILGGLAFLLLGIPGAPLWGLLMCRAGPAARRWRAALVWVPAAAWLALSGSIVKGVVLALLGVLVLGNVDNVVRPRDALGAGAHEHAGADPEPARRGERVRLSSASCWGRSWRRCSPRSSRATSSRTRRPRGLPRRHPRPDARAAAGRFLNKPARERSLLRHDSHADRSSPRPRACAGPAWRPGGAVAAALRRCPLSSPDALQVAVLGLAIGPGGRAAVDVLQPGAGPERLAARGLVANRLRRRASSSRR